MTNNLDALLPALYVKIDDEIGVHRRSEVKPGRACGTASVTGSASLSFGAMPTDGRRDAG
ncbi:hypothetical protein ACFV0L_27740 [Streptosporangium canum]|uniref:hypothetical protein n=1 Tax=Streptosporangium canum TaxID=324952 RepID=UPI003681DF72